MEVEVLPHVAESSVGVLINNSAVWTKGQLPAPSTKVKQLPHEAPMLVEVRQQELLIHTNAELRGYSGCQAWHALAHKAGESHQKIFLQTFMSVQRDPVCHSSELVWGTLHKEAFLPEDRQPMVGYYPR